MHMRTQSSMRILVWHFSMRRVPHSILIFRSRFVLSLLTLPWKELLNVSLLRDLGSHTCSSLDWPPVVLSLNSATKKHIKAELGMPVHLLSMWQWTVYSVLLKLRTSKHSGVGSVLCTFVSLWDMLFLSVCSYLLPVWNKRATSLNRKAEKSLQGTHH